MSWIGKMVGGTIGFALGGPIGAVAGAVFGHAFDVNDQYRLEGGGAHRLLSSEEEAQMTFFVAVFSMLAKLAMADGRISPEEARTVEQFMDRDLSLTPGNKQVAVRIFNQAANSGSSFDAFAEQFYARFKNEPQLLDLMLDILVRVSFADGVLSAQEEKLILSAARIFNYGDAAYQRIRKRYAPDNENDYAVLNCTSSDSDEHIKKQYRKLVQDFHPDKIAAKGLPEEFTVFATEKFQKIQEAYENIKRARNMS
jgi:DnaJ like chaperone protein